MEVNTYKSLYKPLLWGGINREHFILIFLSAIASIMLFKTFRAIFPIIAIYTILVIINRIDTKLITILQENLKFKNVYFH